MLDLVQSRNFRSALHGCDSIWDARRKPTPSHSNHEFVGGCKTWALDTTLVGATKRETWVARPNSTNNWLVFCCFQVFSLGSNACIQILTYQYYHSPANNVWLIFFSMNRLQVQQVDVAKVKTLAKEVMLPLWTWNGQAGSLSWVKAVGRERVGSQGHPVLPL